MALVDSRWQRTVTLCGLYVAQGVPWGFMLLTLPAYLSYKYKVDDTQLGDMKAWILFPWTFKLIWAPIMDSYTIRSMGRRRPWIIGAELLMALSLLGFLGLGDLSQNLNLIICMYVLHNCFASLQDVSTDALAIDILPKEEYGQMNGLMWGSKLVGRGVGAAGLSVVLNEAGIEACVAIQIVLLLAIMLIPIFILERPGEKRFPWSAGEAVEVKESKHRTLRDVLRDYLKAFSLTTMLVYVLFTLLKLIGSGINETVTSTLYTQQLNPIWTDQDFTRASGLYALLPIIMASLIGGFLADRFGRRLMLCAGFGGYALLAMTFAANPALWNETWFSMSYLLACAAFNALGSVAFLSMAMRISWTMAAATVFTTYMTLSNISHIAGDKLAGPVREFLKFSDTSLAANMFSYEMTFWFVGVSSLLPLLLLFFVRPDEVDDARHAEAAEGHSGAVPQT
jgi:PAT family beta-lactamase induction signal transducer AmpG